MKTAIEWLIDKHFGGIENCTPDFRKHIEEAIEMEKEYIMNAYKEGCFDNILDESTDEVRAEQYYNETFNK